MKNKTEKLEQARERMERFSKAKSGEKEMQHGRGPDVPKDAAEDAARTIVTNREFNQWIDEAFAECEKNGGMEHIKGKGKPLDIQTGNGLYGVLKNANVLPQWLQLQHEIRDRLMQLDRLVDSGVGQGIDDELADVNKKIVKYNTIVPSHLFQKPKVFKETLKQQLNNHWV